MKTAMNELRDIININYTHVSMVPETQAIFTYKIALKEILDKINELLEIEKYQIRKANMDGYKEGCTYHSFDHRPKTTEEYYNQTYNS